MRERTGSKHAHERCSPHASQSRRHPRQAVSSQRAGKGLAGRMPARDVIERKQLAPLEKERLKAVLEKLNGLSGPGADFPAQLSKLQRALEGGNSTKVRPCRCLNCVPCAPLCERFVNAHVRAGWVCLGRLRSSSERAPTLRMTLPGTPGDHVAGSNCSVSCLRRRERVSGAVQARQEQVQAGRPCGVQEDGQGGVNSVLKNDIDVRGPTRTPCRPSCRVTD